MSRTRVTPEAAAAMPVSAARTTSFNWRSWSAVRVCSWTSGASAWIWKATTASPNTDRVSMTAGVRAGERCRIRRTVLRKERAVAPAMARAGRKERRAEGATGRGLRSPRRRPS